MEEKNTIKKKILWDTREPVYTGLRHMQLIQSIPKIVWGELSTGLWTMFCLSEMGCLTVLCSQMALMKSSLILKNFIEIILAPSLKEK